MCVIIRHLVFYLLAPWVKVYPINSAYHVCSYPPSCFYLFSSLGEGVPGEREEVSGQGKNIGCSTHLRQDIDIAQTSTIDRPLPRIS